MGDIIEDSYMALDKHHDTILTVGYLNDMTTNGHLFDNYMDTFDLVITGDGPVSPSTAIIDRLFGNKNRRNDDQNFT